MSSSLSPGARVPVGSLLVGLELRRRGTDRYLAREAYKEPGFAVPRVGDSINLAENWSGVGVGWIIWEWKLNAVWLGMSHPFSEEDWLSVAKLWRHSGDKFYCDKKTEQQLLQEEG